MGHEEEIRVGNGWAAGAGEGPVRSVLGHWRAWLGRQEQWAVSVPGPGEMGALSVPFSRSVLSDSVTPWMAVCQASLPITNSLSCSNSCPSSQ